MDWDWISANKPSLESNEEKTLAQLAVLLKTTEEPFLFAAGRRIERELAEPGPPNPDVIGLALTDVRCWAERVGADGAVDWPSRAMPMRSAGTFTGSFVELRGVIVETPKWVTGKTREEILDGAALVRRGAT